MFSTLILNINLQCIDLKFFVVSTKTLHFKLYTESEIDVLYVLNFILLNPFYTALHFM